MTKNLLFDGNAETSGLIAFQGNSQAAEAETQVNDILNEDQSRRRRGESLVNEAHILNHEAMIARTKGDYAAADKLQREANALQKEGNSILENLQLEKLGLNKSEQNWTQRALKQEKITPDVAHKEVSFGASVTCLGGSTVCVGCAGPLIDRKIGCKCGACSGGARLS